MSDSNITELFSHFAGAEVQMNDTAFIPHSTITAGANEYTPYMRQESYKDGDKTITEMQAIARRNGLTLRVQTPSSIEIMDPRYPKRVNVQLKEESDGKWRVQSTFKIG